MDGEVKEGCALVKVSGLRTGVEVKAGSVLGVDILFEGAAISGACMQTES